MTVGQLRGSSALAESVVMDAEIFDFSPRGAMHGCDPTTALASALLPPACYGHSGMSGARLLLARNAVVGAPILLFGALRVPPANGSYHRS